MRFNPKADIRGGRVRDVGGSSGAGGMGNLPIGSITGGGIGTVVIVIIIFVIVQLAGGGSGLGTGTGSQSSTDRYEECLTGADANENADCARVAVEASLRNYWTANLQEQTGTAFRPSQIVTFTGGVATGGCGNASSAVGPFYCPVDEVIYLDTTFFEDVLEGQLGGEGGDFVEPYVLGHEYGHHIQNLLGTMGRVQTQQGPTSDAVRLELQADCYAGMWTRAAESTEDINGVRIFEDIDRADIAEALDAAKTVGDDRIQQQSGGQVDKERWTHGSSAQRMRWFETGYGASSIVDCDTFSASTL
jgi:predicted metalloprotease